MKKVKKFAALLCVMAMVVCSLAGCGSNNKNNDSKNSGDGDKKDTKTAEKMTIKVWAPQEDFNANGDYKKGIITYMLDEFNKAHPEWDITFEPKVLSESNVNTNLTKDPTTAADVFMYPSDQIAALADAKLLYPMNETADDLKKEYDESYVNNVTYNGKVYGYPYTPNGYFLYYDKSLISEEEVKSLETIMNKPTASDVKNFAMDIDNSFYIPAFFFANGCTLFGEDGSDAKSCDFNNAAGVSAAKYIMALDKNKKFLDVNNGNDLALMKKHKLCATVDGGWDAENFKKALGENYAATKLPTANIDGKDVQLSGFMACKLVGVNANTKNPKAAVTLAKFLANEDNQKIRIEARAMAPTLTSLSSSIGDDADPAIKAVAEQGKYSTAQPLIAQMGKFWDPVKAVGVEMLSGKVTDANLQSKLDAMVKDILATGK